MADELLIDGTDNFSGGQDSSKFPSKVPADSYYSAVNITVQNGVPTPRWGLDKAQLQFNSDALDVGNNVMVPYKEIFMSGRYQMSAPYSIGPDNYLLTVVAGLMYLINIDTFVVTIISLSGTDTLNENTPRLNWSKADKYLVIFDYPNVPVILDGITARRSRINAPFYEVPVSTQGTYNQNRLFIANAGNEFTAGDPTGSLLAPAPPISFEEIEAPSAAFLGQIFQLPTNVLNADITAMAFLQFTDTSTGIGPLLVATENQIFSYNSQNPRTTWETGQFGTALVSTGGIAGPRALVNVNSDLFYLGSDGQVRTLSMSRDEQKKWARVPISREIANWLIYNDPSLVKYGVMGYFNNKILVSVNPFKVGAFTRNRTPTFDVAHGGFGILELDDLATLGRDGQPAWPAMWTGVRPMEIITIGNRCFVISKDEDFSNTLYEFNPATTYDTDGSNIRYATGIVYTREYDFKSPFQNKAIHSMDLGLRNVAGDFKIKVEYKPSHGNRFIEWANFEHVAPWRSCTVPDSCAVNGLSPHSFRDLTIGNPLNPGCDEVSSLRYDMFRKLQLKFTISGAYWEFHEYAIKAAAQPQGQQITSCDDYRPVELCGPCNSDWRIGAFRSCLTHQT